MIMQYIQTIFHDYPISINYEYHRTSSEHHIFEDILM